MNRKEQLAFDASADYCKCDLDKNCVASTFQDGYEAGFDKARELARQVAINHEIAWLDDDIEMHAGAIANDIAKLGQDEVADETS